MAAVPSLPKQDQEGERDAPLLHFFHTIPIWDGVESLRLFNHIP
jgi:hypothetical protein